MKSEIFWWFEKPFLRGRFGSKWSFTINDETDFDSDKKRFCLLALYKKGVDTMFFEDTFDTRREAKRKATLLVKKFF